MCSNCCVCMCVGVRTRSFVFCLFFSCCDSMYWQSIFCSHVYHIQQHHLVSLSPHTLSPLAPHSQQHERVCVHLLTSATYLSPAAAAAWRASALRHSYKRYRSALSRTQLTHIQQSTSQQCKHTTTHLLELLDCLIIHPLSLHHLRVPCGQLIAFSLLGGKLALFTLQLLPHTCVLWYGVEG